MKNNKQTIDIFIVEIYTINMIAQINWYIDKKTWHFHDFMDSWIYKIYNDL